MHGRATRTRAWCGHVHAHGKDMHVRVATNRAGILLAIMRPGRLKRKVLYYVKAFSNGFVVDNEWESFKQVWGKEYQQTEDSMR